MIVYSDRTYSWKQDSADKKWQLIMAISKDVKYKIHRNSWRNVGLDDEL